MLELITKDAEATAPEVTETLDELARVGARRMIVEALELEVEQHIQIMRRLRGEDGHALVVRNGRARERTVTLGAGVVKVRADVKFRDGKQVAPYAEREPLLEEEEALRIAA